VIDLVNISIPNAFGYALLGYLVVFLGLVMLMCVIFGMGKIMHKEKKPAAAPAAAAPSAAAPAAAAVKAEPAPGTAGDFKLYNTDPRDAAMVMAIVADSLGKPLNELRFISIREVK
jgi:Na+-transporting methylmalonyl-CoA/oxaloacetate decarboxylase gamma subunit